MCFPDHTNDTITGMKFNTISVLIIIGSLLKPIIYNFSVR
ncbi:hypothetical protein rpr22_0102 [Rickettsia prowazekii str. Rp22]|uniref:Uncharacterized protein n=1 Tax=Rickettsia prowazekii (strain Rp22) TaxID=449216 RepID=D5AW20_RICPP|nr:hypothetical protein rpr22_0102 [Rickettsia prowazekii str. Rp22]